MKAMRISAINSLLVAAIFVCIVLYIPTPNVQAGAQVELTRRCKVLDVNQKWGESFDATFLVCARAVGTQIARHILTDAVGEWGDLWIHAYVDGKVYQASKEQDAEWEYWGNWRLSLKEIIPLAANDINTFWQETFRASKLTYSPVHHIQGFTTAIRTGCGASKMGNAFYCSADDGIYYDSNLLGNFAQKVGDFAPVIILAHEWGHAIQARLGVRSGISTIFLELQADCYAGAYAQYAASMSQKVILEPNDLGEAAYILYVAGDSDSTPWFDPEAHGRPRQRLSAFLEGLVNGVERCRIYTQ